MPTPVLSRPRLQASLAALLAGILWLWLGGIVPAVAFGLAAALALLAWAAPGAHAPVHRLLERAGRGIAVASSWILLAIAYAGLFVPMRLWRALTGRDPLGLRPDPRRETYLRPLPPARPDRFGRMY